MQGEWRNGMLHGAGIIKSYDLGEQMWNINF